MGKHFFSSQEDILLDIFLLEFAEHGRMFTFETILSFKKDFLEWKTES